MKHQNQLCTLAKCASHTSEVCRVKFCVFSTHFQWGYHFQCILTQHFLYLWLNLTSFFLCFFKFWQFVYTQQGSSLYSVLQKGAKFQISTEISISGQKNCCSIGRWKFSGQKLNSFWEKGIFNIVSLHLLCQLNTKSHRSWKRPQFLLSLYFYSLSRRAKCCTLSL